jgi:glycosyltransferase involved in cell wall biosynthesis
MDQLLTFIIPTIGRNTLRRSINSILNQTIENWKLIIIFDGIKSNLNNIKDNKIIKDDRILILESELKLGKGVNSAGDVRNYGMKFVKTEWIAFLDDDDCISDDYIEVFYKEYNKYKMDLFIYRMKLENRIIPKINSDNFYLCDVGISFIMKTKIFENGLKFIPDGAEDYIFLNNVRNQNYKIVISKYVKYFVKTDVILNPYKIYGMNIFINYNKHYDYFITLLGYSILQSNKHLT